MTFEDWWCDESLSDEDNRHIGYEYAKEAWDYQQARIDELEEKIDHLETLLDTVDSALSNWRYHKRRVSDECRNLQLR